MTHFHVVSLSSPYKEGSEAFQINISMRMGSKQQNNNSLQMARVLITFLIFFKK